jgi:polyphosphate kinase
MARAARKSVAGWPVPLPMGDADARFVNRDLSWLEFNRRVQAQAADATLPLLERVRFLTIATSNLDEFFMKRVGILKRLAYARVDEPGPDGLTPRQQLQAIREFVGHLQGEHARLRAEILGLLERAGVALVRYDDLAEPDRRWVDEWFRANVYPALTPLAVNPTHRFPFISNLSENLAVLGEAGAPGEPVFARVKFPATIRQLVRLPGSSTGPARYVRLVDVVRRNLGVLFPGLVIREQAAFRVTRSSGIQRDDLDTANLLQSVEADVKQRRFARVVRLEIERSASPDLRRWLADKLSLEPADVYDMPDGSSVQALAEVADLPRPDLRFPALPPVVPPALAGVREGAQAPAAFFAALRREDVLVFHPYESFHASVERFIASAASDPDVLTIKQTLYRTSPQSPFVESLVKAAESGKQVACLVELRARFDEHHNVRFARQLEKAGVHVAYGVAGLKTHCKISLVVRREKNALRCYAHVGTGNYHPHTAQAYSDLGLLTCDEDITADLVTLFNFLTGLSPAPVFRTLLVAPFTMRRRFAEMIEREGENARRGLPARIGVKINALEDREIIERLYAASAAGVPIDIVCRGFCCLRPGVRGLSENIRVSSVVGRFLEHARIFHFANGHEDPLDGEWFIGSADWMVRNLSNRVEVAAPIRDRRARARLLHILDVHRADCRNAWDITPRGHSVPRAIPPDAPPDSPARLGTFETFIRETARQPGGQDAP